jgi:hypothetical protein
MFSITKDINLNSNNISSNNKRFWRRIMNSINLRNNSFNNNNLLNNQKSKNRWNRSERKHYTYLHKMDSSLWNFNSNSSNSDLINELWTHIVNSFYRKRRWRQQRYNSGRENETSAAEISNKSEEETVVFMGLVTRRLLRVHCRNNNEKHKFRVCQFWTEETRE